MPLPPMPRPPVEWRRVTRAAPCPVCGRPDWCGVAADRSAAICMRISEGAIREIDQGHGIGYLHELDGHREPARDIRTRPQPAPIAAWDVDFESALERWRRSTPPEAIAELAGELGVDRQSLARLDVAYCPERRAWAFPMHDDRRQVIGVRLRSIDTGNKFAINGSHNGAFIPRGLDSRSALLICEGPTDTAAALSLGFQAVGRPSCSGATEIICELLHSGRRRDVVIVADADGPGLFGARRLADRVVGLCRSLKLVSSAPHKDLRSWLQKGLADDVFTLRIRQTRFYAIKQEHGCSDNKKNTRRVGARSQGRGRRDRGQAACEAAKDPTS